MTAIKKTTQRQGFKTSEFVVYPAHGVGQIVSIEEQEVAGAKLELFVINFVKDKMTLRVPTAKITSVGMRKLAEPPMVKHALKTLKGRARIKRTMWSHRAQKYEAKINSATSSPSPRWCATCSVRSRRPRTTYPERQLYEAALDRLSREIAVVQRITETQRRSRRSRRPLPKARAATQAGRGRGCGRGRGSLTVAAPREVPRLQRA